MIDMISYLLDETKESSVRAAADDIPSGRKWVDSVGKVVNVIGSHQMIVSLMVQSEKQMVKKGQKELARRVGDLVQKLKRNSWYCRHEGDVGG